MQIFVCGLQRLDKNHMLLIHCRHKILRTGRVQPLQRVKDQVLPFIPRLDQEHHSSQFYRYLHLLRLIVYIHQQHVIQNQILDKTILVHLLLICK